MYVHSVKLINYKSIGEYKESEMIIEPRVTAIIGRNESGKSNILDGLSMINLISPRENAFANTLSNRSNGSPIKYIIVLKPSKTDLHELNICTDTEIEISEKNYRVTGGLLEYFQNKVAPAFSVLVEALEKISNNPWKITDTNAFNNYRNQIKLLCLTNNVDIPKISNVLASMSERIARNLPEGKHELKELVAAAEEHWKTLKAVLPVFFYRKTNKHLNNTYKLDDIKKEFSSPTNNPNSLLSDYVRLIEISNEDFMLATQNGSTPQQITARSKIERLTEFKINKKFRQFYQTESITLKPTFNDYSVTFAVQSGDGETLSYSERSNGLRWYLETFIDAQAHDVEGSNVVYLFDEPGTSLHVNAQKELIKLFQHLADQGNQVIYTTHSPYMLDTAEEGIHRIRAVVKDDYGYSRIYKTAYDARISPESQEDTLAPIINALGMNLSDTFGPAKNKINIVTEGMSDYIFLCMMAKHLEIDPDKIAIIPSVGAPNCVNICCILRGWGCKHVALFDYDKAGVESGAEILRKDYSCELGKHYCFMKEVSQQDIDSKTYKTTFMVEDVFTQEEIDRFHQETNTAKLGKSLTAKLIANAYEGGQFMPSDVCVENFRVLFKRVITCGDSQ